MNGDHAWFDKYACPDCVKKGKRSTRSSVSLDIVSTSTVEYSDLHGSEAALWSLVLTTSDSSIPTANMKWVCRTAITNVQKSVVGQLDGEHPHVKVSRDQERFRSRPPLILRATPGQRSYARTSQHFVRTTYIVPNFCSD